MADPGFGKGGLMRMCRVATTPPFDAHAQRCNESVLTPSNCRETVSIFASYASSKGVSMETMETPLDPPLIQGAIPLARPSSCYSTMTFTLYIPPIRMQGCV